MVESFFTSLAHLIYLKDTGSLIVGCGADDVVFEGGFEANVSSFGSHVVVGCPANALICGEESVENEVFALHSSS